VLENGLTHFDNSGNAVMVDVSDKAITERIAIAKGKIYVSSDVITAIKEGTAKKGDVLSVSRVAGIMGAKKTADLIPLCHILNLTKVSIDFEINEIKDRDKKGSRKDENKDYNKVIEEVYSTEKESANCQMSENKNFVEVVCTVKTKGVTGVEMEALTGATIALLTIYDMCKAIDKNMELGQIYVVHKEGGKSGTFHREK
jgi:cyclic pyranopterin phosphate synthase